MIGVGVFLVLVSVAFGQENLFKLPVSTEGKSHNAPLPTLLEMPFERLTLPNLAMASVSETSEKQVSLASPMIALPKKMEEVVNIPHSAIPMPQGGHELKDVEYKIEQPIIEVPKPIFQKKQVFFNVPQPIVQVPEPVIRHRPILYKFNPIVRVHNPIVKHEKLFYNVPQAQLAPKSGYSLRN